MAETPAMAAGQSRRPRIVSTRIRTPGTRDKRLMPNADKRMPHRDVRRARALRTLRIAPMRKHKNGGDLGANGPSKGIVHTLSIIGVALRSP